MNIFVLDNDFAKCAEYHVDKHVVKMPTEYCQILSSAHRFWDGELQVRPVTNIETKKSKKMKFYDLPGQDDMLIYKMAHINHPSTVWARTNRNNYLWLYTLTEFVVHEYIERYKKLPKWVSSGLLSRLYYPPANIPAGERTEFALAMPDEYKTNDAIESYRNYYNGSKKELFSWKNRSVPPWITS